MFGLSGLTAWLLTVISVLTLAGYILFNSLVNAKAEISTLQATNQAYVLQIEQNKASQKALELSHQNIVLHYQDKEAQAKRDASKEYVAVSKTNLVQKLANNKFKEQEEEMACHTGNSSKCLSSQ